MIAVIFFSVVLVVAFFVWLEVSSVKSFPIAAPGNAFMVKLVGVTYSNEDGMDRQHVIRSLAKNDPVVLKREPDNEFDKNAIAVLTVDGLKIGYMPAGDSRMRRHLDDGKAYSAYVIRKITGGNERKVGLVIRIEKY